MEKNKNEEIVTKITGKGFLHECGGMDGIYILRIGERIPREVGEAAYRAGYRPGDDVDYYIIVKPKKSVD